MKNYFAEFAGTFGFVFIGCGAVIFAAPFIGYLGISIAFGLAFCAMMYAFPGHHFNPAVTVAAAVSGTFKGRSIWFTLLKTAGCILCQTAGACAAAAVLYVIYSGKTGYVSQGTFAANIIDRYTLRSAFYLETILCFLFLCVFFGSNTKKEHQSIALGFTLTASYLLSYPVTRGSLNPVRTTAAALFSGEPAAMEQLKLFWAAAMLAAAIAGLLFNPAVSRSKKESDQ